MRLPDDATNVECAAPFGDDVIVLGRRGGPEFLDSELARLRATCSAWRVTISRA